jgi:hypothetical protein
MVGILATMGINQNVDIRHLHWNLPPLIPKFGQLLGCLVKMNRFTENGHCKDHLFSLIGFGKKIIPKRSVHQLTQSRSLVSRLSLCASNELVI